jgi:tryptophanyl-tRNA synthetase
MIKYTRYNKDTNMHNKKRLVSGITATGNLTIGNYLGAIKNFVKLQDEYEMYIFVADLHAFSTDDAEPELISERRKSIMAMYIAAGLDPKKTTLFYQSDILEHGVLS